MASDLLSYALNTDPTQLHTHTHTLTRRNAYSLSAVQIRNICTETQVDTHTQQVPHYHSVQVSLMTPRRRQKPTKKQKRLLMRDFTVQTWVGVEASHLNDNEEIHAKEENMNGCRLC